MSTALKQHIEKITALTDAEFSYILSHFTKKEQLEIHFGYKFIGLVKLVTRWAIYHCMVANYIKDN
jgi:hypothetical protein